MPFSELGVNVNRLQKFQIICCIMCIPEIGRFFITGKFFGDRINRFIFVVHNIASQIESCLAQKGE